MPTKSGKGFMILVAGAIALALFVGLNKLLIRMKVPQVVRIILWTAVGIGAFVIASNPTVPEPRRFAWIGFGGAGLLCAFWETRVSTPTKPSSGPPANPAK